MNKDFLTEKAYAKINLALDILHKRLDGYHEVQMIMQSIGLFDTLRLTGASTIEVTVKNQPDLSGGPENLVYQAVKLLCDRYQLPGAKIELEKNIPMAAGLAGGSSDAAAALRLMNRWYNLELSTAELEELAAELGSDVPFCVAGGTQLAYGRGEQLTLLPPLEPCTVILAKLPLAVSTASVYQAYDAQAVQSHPDLATMREKLAKRDLKGVAHLTGNVLESVTLAKHPEIKQLKEALGQTTVLCSLMSGSGPTVFALIDDLAEGKRIAEKLKSQFRADWFVVQTVQGQE